MTINNKFREKNTTHKIVSSSTLSRYRIHRGSKLSEISSPFEINFSTISLFFFSPLSSRQNRRDVRAFFLFPFFFFLFAEPDKRFPQKWSSWSRASYGIVSQFDSALIKVTNRFHLQLLNSCVGYLLTARTLIILFSNSPRDIRSPFVINYESHEEKKGGDKRETIFIYNFFLGE